MVSLLSWEQSAEPIEASPFLLIFGRRAIQGWPSGTSIDSEDTLGFSSLVDIRPMIETMPLERASEAYDRMMAGESAVPDGIDHWALGFDSIPATTTFSHGLRAELVRAQAARLSTEQLTICCISGLLSLVSLDIWLRGQDLNL